CDAAHVAREPWKSCRKKIGIEGNVDVRIFQFVLRLDRLPERHLCPGKHVETQYKLEYADIIISLDADFLYAGFPGFTRYARDYAARRDPDGHMNRLYVIESTPTSTGVKADHRLPMRAAEVEEFTRALASALGINGGGVPPRDTQAKFLHAMVGDLRSQRGNSVVIVGDHQP